jgi:hypothetical protein
MDLWNTSSFRAIEVTAAFERLQYIPGILGQFGPRLFPTRPVWTRDVAIHKRDNVLAIIPTSPIGAPPVELEVQPSDIRPFRTRRIAKGSTVYAEELQGILRAPTFEAVLGLQAEVARRGAVIRGDIELTNEHMRMGAILGQVVDADGTTILDDWFVNWGIAAPTPVNFLLTTPTTNIRMICETVRRNMRLAAKGGWVEGVTEVHALCGWTFYSLLISHPMVERLYLNWQASRELAGAIGDDFVFGGITFHNYRGTDDGTTLTVPDNSARFFPVGGNDVFQRILGPGDFDPFVNQPGREIIGLTIPDRDRGAWLRTEGYQYPLYVCLRPEMLQRGVSS